MQCWKRWGVNTYLRGVLVSEEHFSQDFLVPSALSVLFLLIHGCCISPNMTFQGPLPYQRCTYDWFNFMFLHVFQHSSLIDLIPQLSITFMDQYFISFPWMYSFILQWPDIASTRSWSLLHHCISVARWALSSCLIPYSQSSKPALNYKGIYLYKIKRTRFTLVKETQSI